MNRRATVFLLTTMAPFALLACQPMTASAPADGGASTASDAGTDPADALPLADASSPLPEAAWSPAKERVTWKGLTFAVPQGMKGTDQGSRYDLVDPGNGSGIGACSMTVNAPLAASGDLAQQASDLLKGSYGAQGYEAVDDNGQADLLGQRTVGTSPRGFSYVELRAELRKGAPSDERGHILLIALGGQVVPIVGYSPTTSGCTQLAHDFKTGIVGEVRWREIEFSFEASDLGPKTTLPVVGEWSLLQGASAQEYAFAANGRYGFWGALASERRVSQTELEVTTSSFTGVGSYRLDGDRLALFPDGKPGEAMFVRVFEQHTVSPSLKVSREVRLGMMKRDIGGAYELALVKK